MTNHIPSLLNCNKITLKNTINEFNLYCKKIKEDNIKFLILYNKHNDSNIDKTVFRNMKFIKIKKDSYKLISYNFNNIIDCENLNELNKENIVEGFEGTTINVFYQNNKWHYTTNKTIDINKSQFSSIKTHGEQFSETINKSELQKYLNIKLNYTFILIHYQNKYYIDYTSRFGNEYKKLLFLWCKDEKMNVVKDTNFESQLKLFPNIFKQTKIIDPIFNDKIESFMNIKYNENKEIIIKRVLNEKIIILKKKVPNCNSEIERQLFSFQHNKLGEYLLFRFNNIKHDKINLISLYKNIFNYITELLYEIYYTKIYKFDDNILMITISKIQKITEKNMKPYPTKNFIYNYLHYHLKEGILFKIISYACSKKCFLEYKKIFKFNSYWNYINDFIDLYLNN